MEKRNRLDISIDRIKNINYFNFLKGEKDICNTIEDICCCKTLKEISKCTYCKYLCEGIGSRSSGNKYTEMNIPRWNVTFTAGGVRSDKRTHYGIYKIRAKSHLHTKCRSVIYFSKFDYETSMFKDRELYQEISLTFKADDIKSVVLKIIINYDNYRLNIRKKLNPSDITFNVNEYNNYTLLWSAHKITVLVNDEKLYSSPFGQTIPRLPGYTYLSVCPSYNTNSKKLIQTIKREFNPTIYIKSFSYNKLE